jgi:glycosyltransferase involved in cell wall biosynthesis
MSHLKKIIWFVTNFNVAGGGERFVLEAEKVLNASGITCHIVCMSYDRKALYGGKYDVDVIELDPRGNEGDRHIFAKTKRYICSMLVLRNLIGQIDPDIILCQDFGGYVLVMLSTLFSRYPYGIFDFGQMHLFGGHKVASTFFYRKKSIEISKQVSLCGEFDCVPRPAANPVARVIDEIKGLLIFLSFKKAKYIFTLSNKVKDEDNLLYAKDAIVIKGAYSEDIFEYRPKIDLKNDLGLQNRAIIFYMGRLVSNKRVDLCIRALYMLKKRRPNALLLIGGTGQEEQKLKHLVAELRLNNHVRFLGFIDEELLYDYYSACDVFTTMDHADFDITAHVALALGKMVVWPKVMEIDDNLKGNDRIFPCLPKPDEIAIAFERALDTKKTPYTTEEKEKLFKYTWSFCFRVLIKAISQ